MLHIRYSISRECSARILFYVIAILAVLVTAGKLEATPCYPSDPEGKNPENECLPYPPYPQGVGATVGEGKKASYSEYGSYPPNTNPRMNTKGYWTGIDVNGTSGVIRIDDSQGRSRSF